MRPIERILVVEDDLALQRALLRVTSSMEAATAVAATLADGLAKLRAGVDLVLLDVRLPDGSGVAIAEAAAHLRPAPLVVAISGEAEPGEAFRLAQAGVLAYVEKPFSLRELRSAIHAARTSAPRIEPLVSAAVGQSEMKQVQDAVRQTMVEQAMAITNGNRSDAARLLRISRQAVQNLLRRSRWSKK